MAQGVSVLDPEVLGEAERNSPSRAKRSVIQGLGWLDRLLAVWILLAIIIGIVLGNFVPGIEQALQSGKFVNVSVPIAIGLLVMMYPILCKVQFESMHRILQEKEIWVQLAFSVFMNWIIAPLLMVSSPPLPPGLLLLGC